MKVLPRRVEDRFQTGLRTLLRVVRRVMLYATLCIGGLFAGAPLLWMLSSSLKSPSQLYVWPPAWIPNPIDWNNYPEAWQEFPFALFYRNSAIVTASCIVGVLVSCSIVAYGFARLRFPGRDAIFLVLLATMMLPTQVTMIPRYILFARLGWVNSFKPLIVPAWLALSPYLVFLLRQFFMTIPSELDDAARIDGCGYLGIFARIILPLSKPALGITAVFTFSSTWNDYMQPLLYLQSLKKYTVQLGLSMFERPTWHDQAANMAMAIVALLPQLVVFFVAQRYFVQGVALSGIKR